MSDVRDIIQKNSNIAEFLINSGNIAILLLDKDNNISFCNGCLKKLLNLPEKPLQKHVFDYLMGESRSEFPLNDGSSLILNFLSLVKNPVPLSCFISKQEDDSTLIIGTKVMLTNDYVMNQMALMANELSNISRELKHKNKALKEAQASIKVLSGIIPICMHCKEIRDDDGFWNNLEMFISNHSEAKFSHGICPDCMKKYYSDYMKDKD